MKSVLIAWAVAALFLSGVAHAEDSSLVVAGRGASLEQALAGPHASSYRLLVMREQLLRLRVNPQEEEASRLLNHARHDGAVVFVCERDLRAERLQRSDLVPGVVSIAAGTDWVNGAPSEADVALRRLCS